MTQEKRSNWNEYINPVLDKIPPSGIRRFFDLAAEVQGVISLGVGEPDFITPWHIRENCINTYEQGLTAYTSNAGLPQLRQAIAENIARNYQIEYDWKNEILVTVGVSEALDLAFRALLKPGDEVIVTEPAYVSYQPSILMAGGTPVVVVTKFENGFQLTAEQVASVITPRTKAIMLSYPNNPTGATIDRQVLADICELAVEHDLLIISDEVYDKLTYEGEHSCVAAMPGMRDRTVLLNGFSKAYAMTGARVGYACSNPDFIAAMTKLHQYSMLCASTNSQYGALEALRNGEQAMRRMVEEYSLRRRLVVQAFNDMGLPCVNPRGAFYAFPDISSTGMDSETFCQQLLTEEKVAVVPGTAFGRSGEGFIRVSYASSTANLTEAFSRMDRFVKRHRGN